MQQKQLNWESLGNWYSLFSPLWVLFSIRFPYGTLHHMENAWLFSSISHSMGKCSKTHPVRETCNINTHTSLSNSKIFASTNNYQHKSKIIELVLPVVWNTSAIKLANLNLEYNGKMAGHSSNSAFVLKLVSRIFCIQKSNLRTTVFPAAYFELWEK